MEFSKVVQDRISVRHFAEKPIDESTIRELVRLAGLAPSINNSQPWKFIAVTNRDVLRQMADAVHLRLNELLPENTESGTPDLKAKVDWFSTFFVDAPCVIAVLRAPYQAVADQILPGHELSHEELNKLRGQPDLLSIGASIQNLLLAATDMGLGACWLSGPLVARDQLEGFLSVSEPWSLAAMVAVGHAAGWPTSRERKPVDEILEIVS